MTLFVSASIAIDPGHHASPETVTVARRVTSGRVVVPTTTDCLTCSFPLHASHTLDADVMLSRDWLDACSLSTVGPYISDPSLAAQAVLLSCFAWARYSSIPGTLLLMYF